MIELLNIDCMEYMKTLPDKAFDLSVVDPPYGIGEDGGKFRDRIGGGHRIHIKKKWDDGIPTKEYFDQLKRVSNNQIIWGANYLTKYLPSSMGWIYWNKMMGGDFSDGELAYTSFQRALKSFSFCNKIGGQIQPCQKPVALYDWILRNYAKPGQRILDTHLGSGSSAIAAHYFGCDFVGCEIDTDYFNAAKERFDRETRQVAMF